MVRLLHSPAPLVTQQPTRRFRAICLRRCSCSMQCRAAIRCKVITLFLMMESMTNLRRLAAQVHQIAVPHRRVLRRPILRRRVRHHRRAVAIPLRPLPPLLHPQIPVVRAAAAVQVRRLNRAQAAKAANRAAAAVLRRIHQARQATQARRVRPVRRVNLVHRRVVRLPRR